MSGQDCGNRRVFSLGRKTVSEVAEVMLSERLVQILGPTTAANDWSMTVTGHDGRTSIADLTGAGFVMACQLQDVAGRTGNEAPCREELCRR